MRRSLDDEKSYIITDTFMLKDGDVIRMFMNSEDFPVDSEKQEECRVGLLAI